MIRIRILLTALLVLLGAAPMSTLAAENQATYLSIDCDSDETYDYNPVDIFDPDFDTARKAELIKNVEARAEASCPYDQYVLGTLLRFGRKFPGNPLEKNIARAKTLIEAYARSGMVLAFADLAQLSLAAGQAQDAMLWTQVYLYFATRHPNDGLKEYNRRGYNAYLLVRATEAWHKAGLKKADIEPLLKSYLSKHKAEILANMHKARPQTSPAAKTSSGEASHPPELRVKSGATDVRTFVDMQPGYAVFLLEVQPSGVVSRIVTESFAPTPDVALNLKRMVEGYSFEPFKWHKPQVVRVPVVYGYADGPSLAIPR
ncbi:MAG TPA: hypothetical protein VHF02_04575 [Luteimonas sp.]|nr:hypothetical protein [Luteimonas sp.]